MSLAIRSLATRLYQRLTQKSAHRPHAPQHRVRLGLEQFEAREVPAALTWTNSAGNNDFYTASNWVVTGTSTISTAAPMAGDDVTFNGGVSSANCNNLGVLQIPTGGGGTNAVGPMSFASTLTTTPTGLNSLNLINGYAGTVSVVAPLWTATFVLSAGTTGAISQAHSPAGNDISVTQTFTWTRGTLNSSANLANVNILGNGSIAPVAAGTVSLGSNLIFTGTSAAPTTTTQDPGTVLVTNAAGSIIVGAFANVTARTLTSGDIIGLTVNQIGAQKYEIQANGTLKILGPGKYNCDLQVCNVGGALELEGMVRVTLNGGSELKVDYYTEIDTASQTRIENGSTLTVPHAMRLNAGSTLFLKMNPGLPANQQTATINGKFIFDGGTILFSIPLTIGTALTYGTFTVNGNVEWYGGTYTPSVDYTAAGLANKWIVNGTMTLPPTSTGVLQPNPQRGQNPPANSTWTVLDATATAGNAPTVAGNQLTLGVFNGGRGKIWRLAS